MRTKPPDERIVIMEKYPDFYVGYGVSAKNLDQNIAIEQAKTNALIDISPHTISSRNGLRDGTI